MTVPLLIVSDSPAGHSGLGRITEQIAHKIATRLSKEFKVGVAGIGAGSDALGYPVYPMPMQYGDALPYIWQEHCGNENGILLFILNAVWLEWLAFPHTLPFGELREFVIGHPSIKKWCYVPVDSEAAGGKLPDKEIAILSKFDRVLAYTQFGSKLIGQGLHQFPEWQVPWRLGPIPHLPHGTNTNVFHPRPRKEARTLHFGPKILKSPVSLDAQTLLLGVIATNSARKDWPLAFETLAELLARGVNAGLWAHTDRIDGPWGNLVDMAKAFGVRDSVQFTASNLSDTDMAWGYASCDVTLGIGSGGGWEMPLSESLACGIPVVTGNYAGVTEFIPEAYRVAPWAWRYDPVFFSKRPVYRAADWADRILWAKDQDIFLDPKFTWDGCWPAWEAWLKDGL